MLEGERMKDAYYFSHDSNAKDDPKCVLLIEQLGLEGYGIFWVLIETLRDQPGYKYPLNLLPALARRYNTTSEKMKTVVNSYELFQVDDNDFFSLSLMERMEKLDNKRERARIAGLRSAEVRRLNVGSTDVQQTFNDRSTSKVKESKVNKSKTKESKVKEFIPPTLEEIKKYAIERNMILDCDFFFNFFTDNDWIDSQGHKVKSWKQKMLTWDKKEKEKNPQQVAPQNMTPNDVIDFIKRGNRR